MKQFSITLPAHIIAAANICAAKNDIRWYLNGVILTRSGWVVGTNGHVMFFSQKNNIKLPKGIDSIRFKFDKSFKAGKHLLLNIFVNYEAVSPESKCFGSAFISEIGEFNICLANHCAKIISFTGAINEKQVDFSSIIPKSFDVGVTDFCLNMQYLQKAGDIAKMFSNHAPVKMLFNTKSQATLCRFPGAGDEVGMLIMPLRD